MAFTVGINKNMGQMFEDLETLMLQEGWEKIGKNTISSLVTSRGYTYTGSAIASPGKYPDTTGVTIETSSHYFTHSLYAAATTPSVTFYNDYPTEFSVSFWFKFGGFKLGNGVVALPSDKLITSFYNSANNRMGIDIQVDKYGTIGDYLVFDSTLYLMNEYFNNKLGIEYEHIIITYSNLLKTQKLYINGILIEELPWGTTYGAYTKYGTLWKIGGNYCPALTFDELIVWNKVLSDAEVVSIYNSPVPIPKDYPGVFEKYTNYIKVDKGGIFQNTSSQGSPLYISILQNASYNIVLSSPIFTNLNSQLGADEFIAKSVGAEVTTRVLAGVSDVYNILKKYWLVVSRDRIIISYKLYDPTALRTTPLYQVGYIGKLKTLGNDGIGVFTAGTTNTATYLWTTSGLNSGVINSTTSSYRMGYNGYLGVTIGHINTTLSSLYSISNSAFLAGINVSYGSSAIGSVDGVFVVANTQASPEDIITINTTDYVIIPNADTGAGSYYLAVKLN